jgi:hypothetical protein
LRRSEVRALLNLSESASNMAEGYWFRLRAQK